MREVAAVLQDWRTGVCAPTPVTRPAAGAAVTTKHATIARIEASAIELFASGGYEGTSLRDIAARADVSLSAIDRHFGTKLDLFTEIYQRIWKEINLDWQLLLREPAAVDLQGRPTLDGLLRSLILPIVRRARGDACQTPVVRVLSEFNAMRVHLELRNGTGPTVLAERWVSAMMDVCPGLGRIKAVWALSFVISTMLSTQLLRNWLEELMPDGDGPSADELAALMVDFCRGGILGMAA